MEYLKKVCFLLFVLFNINVQANFNWNLPPQDLTSFDDLATTPQICCDNSGNAFAVWSIKLSGTSNFFVQTAFFDGNTFTWSNFTTLSDDSQDAFGARICCDNSGNAIAVWQRSNGTDSIIQASHFDGSSWSSVIDLSEPGEGAFIPQVCCDNSGNAIAVWVRSNGTNSIIQSSYFDGSSWSSVMDLSEPGESAAPPQVCCDNAGNAIAVWQRTNGTNTIIQAAHFDGSSWAPSESGINLSAPGLNSFNPQVCCDNLGNAIVVWEQHNGTNIIVQSAHFDGNSWSGVSNLSEAGKNSTRPQACCDDSGNGVAVWTGEEGVNEIIKSSFFDGSDWTPLDSIYDLSEPSLSTGKPHVCCDNLGNAFAIWIRYNGTNHIVQSSRYNGSSWEPFESGDNLSEGGDQSDNPQICCNSLGQSIAIWDRGSLSNAIIQSTFYLPQIFPPSNFQGNRVTNQFPTQSAVSAHLSWTPNTDPSITAFLIFKNGVLLTTISSNFSSYTDCNISPCQSYSYSIVSINVIGDESDAEIIEL